MTGYVIDASVAVKWLVQEDYSREAAGLLTSSPTLVAPELLFAEAANAIWAMLRRGDIDAEGYADAVVLLEALPVGVPRSMRELTAPASRLARDLDHPIYDCFYLALAVQQQYPVVTADNRFMAKVRNHAYLSDHMCHVEQLA